MPLREDCLLSQCQKTKLGFCGPSRPSTDMSKDDQNGLLGASGLLLQFHHSAGTAFGVHIGMLPRFDPQGAAYRKEITPISRERDVRNLGIGGFKGPEGSESWATSTTSLDTL